MLEHVLVFCILCLAFYYLTTCLTRCAMFHRERNAIVKTVIVVIDSNFNGTKSDLLCNYDELHLPLTNVKCLKHISFCDDDI